MSNTLLEMIRSKHEEIEQLEKALTKAIQFKDNNPKERVTAEMIMHQMLNLTQKRTKELIELYEDKDGLYKEEIQILAGNKNHLDSNLNLLYNPQKTQRTPDVWFNFYGKLKEIKETNKRNILSHDINENITADKVFNLMLDEINAKSLFTADENKGKCVDMHLFHLQFINIPHIEDIDVFKKKDYLSYYKVIDKFDMIPLKIKLKIKYQKYIQAVLDYLKAFFLKINPMVDFNQVQDIIDSTFEENWIKRDIPGWKWINEHNAFLTHNDNNDNNNNDNNNNDNNMQKTINEDNTHNNNDNNQNKSGNEVLYCIYCQKEFKKQTLFNSHLKGKKHIKKEQTLKNKSSEEDYYENLRELAYYEYQITRYKDLLSEVFENTQNQIRKKQAMNFAELEADVVNETEIKKIAIDENDSKPIYNPKNVPIGWDGKPIPYWLYKVHGLGIEYKCEICGEASYWGRKAYEHHFQEWRHTFGMKCLRLPNTMQFKEVTSIEDALKLHQMIIENEKKNEFRPELEEEFEDNEGNLVNKKMYLDLIRQGLIKK